MSERTTIFLDTETTGLDRRTRRIWDLGYIVRRPGRPDVERQFFIDVSLKKADPMSLKIGGYYERHPNPYSMGFAGVMSSYNADDVAQIVVRDFHGATLVGAVPSFDEESLAHMLFSANLTPTWHYHLVDIETFAAGALRMAPPWDFDALLGLYGLRYDEAERHTALGDARMVRDLYDAVLAKVEV